MKTASILFTLLVTVLIASCQVSNHSLINPANANQELLELTDKTTLWEKLAPSQRKRIEDFLRMKLGLSSTGTIELIGSYKTIEEKDFSQHGDLIFHFIQKDLFGDRLFWSTLINSTNNKSLLIYHCAPGSSKDKIQDIK